MLTSGLAAAAGLTLGCAIGTADWAGEATGLGAATAVTRGAVVGLVAADGAQAVSVKVVLASTRTIQVLGMVVARALAEAAAE